MEEKTQVSLPVGQEDKTRLDAVINIIYLTTENSRFRKVNEFLTLKATVPNENGEPEEKSWPRIYLHRAFPFDMADKYISVLDKDKKEIGLIRDIHEFDPETQKLLTEELERKYYAPVVTKIYSVKERYGFSYWVVDTSSGRMSFTLQDTYRSLLKAGKDRIFIIDMDGNRYEIPDLNKLDFKSYKKIELYL